jgi:hypothetical protein
VPVTPDAGIRLVPVVQPTTIAAGELQGRAIAMAWTGDQMIYLVTARESKSAPVWIAENEITNSSNSSLNISS